MLETGALTRSDVQREIDLGYFRPSLMRELEDRPHSGGWNEAAAKAYRELDKKAGFVKHAEVYRRKKLRADAIKRLQKA
jgi:hypothetical protein